jgi:transketolase C-terminal domain/subunit
MSQRYVPLAELRRIRELTADAPILCLDNHYPAGGQGDGVTAALAAAGRPAAGRVRRLAVETVPACGANDEVLRAHRLDPAGVAAAVRGGIGEPA